MANNIFAAPISGRALNVVKAAFPHLTRGELGKLFTRGRIMFRGVKIKKSEQIVAGTELEADLTDSEKQGVIAAPPAADLAVVFEDDALIVLDKPPNMHTVPVRFREAATLMNMLRANRATITAGGVLNAGSINRLDFETSGLVLVAKTDAAFETMYAAYHSGAVEKYYLARVAGAVNAPMVMEDRIRKIREQRERMAVGETGLPARAEVSVIGTVGTDSLLLVKLITGVRHQIRVQLAARGLPIVGDAGYGGRLHERMLLHSYMIEMTHPLSGKRMTIAAPPPDMFFH
ncbi:MAG: RluA family pseudouridine synthase [Spirochaetes bacterium]|nr:RluA family pseudouridine synthase [Spirochaetota bacterium]